MRLTPKSAVTCVAFQPASNNKKAASFSPGQAPGMVSATDSKFVRVTSGWVSTSAFIGFEIARLRLACKHIMGVYYRTSGA